MAEIQSPEAQPQQAQPQQAQPQQAQPQQAQPQEVQPQEVQPTQVAAMSGEENDLAQAWAATVRALGRQKGKKYNLGALLRDCRPGSISLEGETLVLGFSHRTHMERMQEEMEDPKSRGAVSETINQCFNRPYEFKIILIEDNGTGGPSPRTAQNSPLVRTAMGMGARILEEVPE